MSGTLSTRGLVEGRIGRLVDQKFRITRLVAMGGMAAVYEAVQPDGRRVALKMLPPAYGAVLERRKRLLREAYLANNLGHADVVHVFADGVDEDGSAFLVMELLQGESVADMQKAAGGRLDVTRVLWVADRVLDVLAVAHAAGVVHRDIKPDNLFVTAQGRLKVLDFGVARLDEQVAGMTLQTLPGTMLGTLSYMPPEQARGNSQEMDQRTDLWALGATLFNLLSGDFVHAAETPNERLGMAAMKQARSLREACPGLPDKVVQAIDRALRFDRHERWPDARSMQRALREASDTLVPGELWQGPLRGPLPVDAVARTPMAKARAALAEISEYRVPRLGLRKLALLGGVLLLGLAAVAALLARAAQPVVAPDAPQPLAAGVATVKPALAPAQPTPLPAPIAPQADTIPRGLLSPEASRSASGTGLQAPRAAPAPRAPQAAGQTPRPRPHVAPALVAPHPRVKRDEIIEPW